MTSDPFIGQTAGGVYLIERHVADGGIGRVYCGRHLRLGHQVAVKVLSAEHNASLEARHRFEREARIAAELAHPHIVKVYDFDVLPDGNYFLTMEWLEGETLECLLRRGLNSAAIIDILSQLAGAIDFAHAKGAIHRDLKPANVFVISDGLQGKYYAKILDFGIAKMHQHTTGITTQADVIMGTPAYMAPEQAEGTRAIGPAADRYAFAAIAMEMIAGILPHSLNTPSRMLVSLLTGDAQLPSASGTCYQHLDDVFRKAFARHPAARFPSCVAFVEQLIPLLVRHDETPFAPTLQQRRLSVVPSWRRWFLLLIVAAVLGMAGTVGYMMSRAKVHTLTSSPHIEVRDKPVAQTKTVEGPDTAQGSLSGVAVPQSAPPTTTSTPRPKPPRPKKRAQETPDKKTDLELPMPEEVFVP